MRLRAVLPTLLAGAALTVSGCTAPLPEVTFFAAGHTTAIQPDGYCSTDLTRCPTNKEAVARLAVPPGSPVQISVPAEVSDYPWVVLFQYRAADGTSQQASSELFGAGQRHAYTLTLPGPALRLQAVVVRQLRAVSDGPQKDKLTMAGEWGLLVS